MPAARAEMQARMARRHIAEPVLGLVVMQQLPAVRVERVAILRGAVEVGLGLIQAIPARTQPAARVERLAQQSLRILGPAALRVCLAARLRVARVRTEIARPPAKGAAVAVRIMLAPAGRAALAASPAVEAVAAAAERI